MIVYLIKSGLCLAFLLGIYLLFLEREKMHRFNRFFLLFALVFGVSVPLFTIDLGIKKTLPNFNWTEQPQTTISPLDQTSMPVTDPQPNEWPVKEAGFILYGIVTTVLFIRFTRSLMGLIRNIRTSPQAYYHRSKLVLCKENVVPHSFMGYIFLNETKFRNETIEEEIIEHERVHVQQMHSLDILFAELLKIVFWFNPILYFYKNAIQLNHEFIADEIVTQQTCDISAYQKILLQHSSKHPSIVLASSFNYSLTKKRFIMMRKKSSNAIMALKKTLLIPFLFIPIFLFSGQGNAQDSLKVADLYENDHSFELKNLKIESHSEDDHMAIIKLFLIMDSPVLFQLSIEEETVTILNKDLPAGSHNIHFDYSNITDADFRFTFSVGKDNVEIEGPFIEEGTLMTTGDTLSKPDPAKIRKTLDMTFETWQQKWDAYREIEPIESNFKKLKEAYFIAMEYHKILGEAQRHYYNTISEMEPPLPPIPLDPETRIKNQ